MATSIRKRDTPEKTTSRAAAPRGRPAAPPVPLSVPTPAMASDAAHLLGLG
jgi:hypothetical protein